MNENKLFCQSCGEKINENAKFCESCGAQTLAEQAKNEAERARNYEAHLDKSYGGSILITAVVVVFALVIVLLYGFDGGEGTVASVTAIAFAVIISGIKWYFEIKNQRKWKAEAAFKNGPDIKTEKKPGEN